VGAFFLVIHVLVCIGLILIILMQSSKGGGLAGAFGGGGAMGSVFGGRGAATFLSKTTIALAVIFMLSSIGHSLFSGGFRGGPRSVIQQEAMQNRGTSPAASLPGVPVLDQGQTGEQTAPPVTGEQEKKEETGKKDEGKPPTEKK